MTSDAKNSSIVKYPQLSEGYIKSILASQKFFYRGKQYFEAGNVGEVRYYKSTARFGAVVQGTQQYHCKVSISAGKLLYSECDCPAHENYPGPCKHIVALLLKINSLAQTQRRIMREARETRLNSRSVHVTQDSEVISVTDKISENNSAQSLQKTSNETLETQNASIEKKLQPTHRQETESPQSSKSQNESKQKVHITGDVDAWTILLWCLPIVLPIIVGVSMAIAGVGR